MKRIGMMNIKEILQHRHGLGLTRAQTASAVGVSTGTVSHILERASAAGLSWPLPDGLDDEALRARLYPSVAREANQLFAELEARIAENIEQAVEAGSFEVGVETVRADSLSVAGRETLYEHPGTGAATDLVEIRRRDRLVPLTAEAALDIGGHETGGGHRLHHPPGTGRPRMAPIGRKSRT